jgi:hypothetical protein
MDILIEAIEPVWQVALGALILGAGLPALFALGLRSLYGGETLVANPDGTAQLTKPSAAAKAGAVICFGITIAAVFFGIVVIVFGKQLFGS